ncbi:uncharacterized protein LOC116026924 [Ipomoea triloba]|uniref:uncharacterized protein LOC116026924 n=1 Tax=Ipomoea triloba TaxID=35885 RepID=UPI00125E519D|nr:uncharacterized protein LOC116026924 [Ipomoea triloba]
MTIISWNCQGAASKSFLRAAKHIIATYKPKLMCLLEPKISGSEADKVCRKLALDQWMRIEALGFSGGIWIMWNECWIVDIRLTHPQFALVDIIYESNRKWNLACVYGSPSLHLRNRLWENLGRVQGSIEGPWMAIGDFNSITCAEEVSNPDTFAANRCTKFKAWLDREGMVDIGFSGPKFTWTRGKNSEHFRGARLDRAVCSPE